MSIYFGLFNIFRGLVVNPTFIYILYLQIGITDNLHKFPNSRFTGAHDDVTEMSICTDHSPFVRD